MKTETAYWSGMKLPKGSTSSIYFDCKGVWYQIIQSKDKYILYRKESNGEFTQIGTGNHPLKLETRVREGKLK
jgi:hypothetical protein